MKNKEINNIMKEAKDYNQSDEEIIIIGNLGDGYQDKTEDDIFVEIIKVNDDMQGKMTEEEYNAIFEKLNDMRPVLSESQIAKLDMVIELLNKEI